MTRKKFSWAEQYQVHWALLLVAILIGWLFEVRGGGWEMKEETID